MIRTITELYDMISYMVDLLREMQDGDSITTYQLLREAGYGEDDFDEGELTEIHSELFKAAADNKIELDMSAHFGKLEGLPYNLDFVVRNKDAQIKCPHCGSTDTARILYGMPAFDEELERKIDTGKVTLGGCMMTAVKAGGYDVIINADRHCNDCREDFASPPVFLAEDGRSGELYRDIVTSIEFSVGGYFGGFITNIVKDDDGASVSVKHTLDDASEKTFRITADRWFEIIEQLYEEMYLHEWEKSYVAFGILDGEQWNLKISFTGDRSEEYEGSNAYPPYWEELTELFDGITEGN